MANDCINPNIDSDLIGNVDVTEIEWREAAPRSFFMIAKYVSRPAGRWMSSVYVSFMRVTPATARTIPCALIEYKIA